MLGLVLNYNTESLLANACKAKAVVRLISVVGEAGSRWCVSWGCMSSAVRVIMFRLCNACDGGIVHTLALGPLLLSFLRSCRCWRHFVRYAMGDGGDTVSEVEVLQGQPNSASAGLARGLT